MSLSREELKRFGAHLETKLQAIEQAISDPDFSVDDHDTFAGRATANAYKRAALNEIRTEFEMELNSTKDENDE